MTVRILLLGDAALNDFDEVNQWVNRHAGADAVRTTANMATIGRLIEGEQWHADLVVVRQAWPDQFSEADVHELIAYCPLARIVCCFGPWCDSDGRTRSVWPLATRVSAALAIARLEHEWRLIADSNEAGRPLPLTASRSEIFECDFSGGLPPRAPAQRALAISPDRRWREMVEAALRATKEIRDRSTHSESESRPAAVLFDADPWDDERAAALRVTRAAHPGDRVVACVGFPRPDLNEALRSSGADEVWFKLAPLATLVERLL